jgi:hypothetical protein
MDQRALFGLSLMDFSGHPTANILMSMFLLVLGVSFRIDHFLGTVAIVQVMFSNSANFIQICETVTAARALSSYK